MDVTDTENYKNIISEFKDLSPIPHKVPTIFEISGYPHFEEVISNVLSFFFNSDNEHQLSDVLVKSLMIAAGIPEEKLDIADLTVNNVQREKLTRKGNRIDLIVETESFCIAIENKINADLYNDFEDYQSYVLSECTDQEEAVFIVLSLRDKDRPSNWNSHNFSLLTYDQFFGELENRVGKALLDTDAKYTTYLSDLIKTLRNMNKKTELSDEFLEFLSKNRSHVESLYTRAFKDFKAEAKSRADQIDNAVEVGETGFERTHYNRRDKLKYVQVYNKMIDRDGKSMKLQVKLRIIPSRYVLEVWTHDSADNQLFRQFIENSFDKSFSEWETHEDSESGSIVYEEFEYGSNPEDVAEEVEKLLQRF